MTMLRSVDADLADLVQVKARAKEVAVATNIKDNQEQVYGPLVAGTSESGAAAAGYVADRVGDVVDGLTDTVSLAGWLAKNLVWIVGGVLAIVMIGGAVYVWRNGELVKSALKKVAT
jgi:hypothetical protein